jgi:hypothetical protein
MIEKYTIGITNGNRNSSLDFPCSINDTFYIGSDLYFCCPLSLVNSLTGLSINSGNISNYVAGTRITTNSSGEPFIENFESFPLSIVDNFLVANITPLTNEISNDYLLNRMTPSEVFKLYKQYFISIIIGTQANIQIQLAQFLPTHFIQPLNLVLNTLEAGPYDVSFSQLDLCNPNDFTNAERKTILENNPLMIGGEAIRAFYPTNLPAGSKSPLIFTFHGNNQITENYDYILSTAASYGYFGASIPIDQNVIGPCPGCYYAIKLIDHLQQNQSKIKNGYFNNKLDFSRINLSGHSRGGDLIDYIGLALQNKNGTYSPVKNSLLNLSNIKCLFPLAQVTSGTITTDGIVADSDITTRLPNNSTIELFKRNHGIPTLAIRAKYDNQAGPEAHTTLMITGYDEILKVNTTDKGVVIFDHAEHSQLSDYYFRDFVNDGVNEFPVGRIETNHTFNSTSIPRNKISSSILQFLSINNFNSDKLKKLRFIDYRINNQKSIFSQKVPCHEFFYNKFSDLKYMLDSFQGSTLSYAGLTGFTISPYIGHTYGIAVDSDYFNLNPAYTTSASQDAINSVRPILRFLFNTIGGVDYQADVNPLDTFNGIMDLTYSGLFIPIESNISLGYTFTSPINLSENNYLALRGSLIAFDDTVSIGNTLNANFNITVIDNNNNSSTLTSKNTSIGFEKEFRITTTPGLRSLGYSINNCVPTNIFFRAGDFNIKNSSININEIKQIRLDFGPDYGSTFAHIVFDEFVVYKEL